MGKIKGRILSTEACLNQSFQLGLISRIKFVIFQSVFSLGGALVSTGLLKCELRAEGLVGLVKKPENNKC